MRALALFVCLGLAGCPREPASLAPRASASAAPALAAPASLPSSSSSAPELAASATAEPLPAAPAIVSAPPEVIPKLYAAFFEKGRVWKLAVSTRATFSEGPGAKKTALQSSTAICSVTDVQKAPYGWASHVDCSGLEPNGPDEPLSGLWIATQDGLFHVAKGGDLDTSALVQSKVFLAADAKPSHVETRDAQNKEFGSAKTVKRDGAAVCVEESEWSGDDSWTTVCFAADVGIRSAAYGWGGGSTHETKVRVRP